ncbi:hypothetical protein F5Y13DRAFT_207196 [Hypoxylon sp. FL1857]|nr:hypothetical protein F5Y13DRAFT_207196 [Hypoxylon sp. FL1857]
MISPARLLPLFLLSPTFATALSGFVAHQEKGCNTQLDIWSDGKKVENNTLIINRSIKDWDHAAGHAYDNVTFPTAKPTGDTTKDAGTHFVYWKVEQPDPTCQFILMTDSGRGWQILNKLPGDEILRVSREGCYYTALSPNENLITSFCCGHDDCAIAEVEVQKPQAKDTTSGEPPECKLIRYDSTPTIEDGTQIAITRPQTCEAEPACTHSITQSHTVSTAVSHFQSYTWTTELGVDVGIEAGIDFIGDIKAKVGLSGSIAQSWMDEIGVTITEGNVTTTEEGGRQEVGTVAFYSFTPQYECYKGDLSCGKDKDGNEVVLEDISFCQPRPSTADGGPDGVFRMVYISG